MKIVNKLIIPGVNAGEGNEFVPVEILIVQVSDGSYGWRLPEESIDPQDFSRVYRSQDEAEVAARAHVAGSAWI